MASGEMEKSVKEKEPKQPSASAPPSSQEPSSAVSADIATSHSSGSQASSPQPHPYMRGVQHMMLPYGTPPPPHPYVTMYPPGGMYAHPSMPPGSYPYTPYAMPSPNGVTEASGTTIGGIEGDSKRSDVKEKFRIRRLKRRLKMMRGKRPPVSQNVPIMPKTAAGVPGPPTNLNIGMGYWGAPIPGMHGKVSTPVPGDGGRSQPWLQDVTEPKRQRRRQSNRESARRSRLRKEAGFGELARYTEGLNAENASLRAEMNRLKSQREELTSENTSLKNMMPPYGTPPPHPYVKMYPPGGMYAHPSMPPGSYPKGPYAMPSQNGMAETSGHTSGGTEGDSKRSDVKEKLPIRRSERILNMTRGKNNGTGKNSEASAYSESGESASDGSSGGSDANSENDSGSEQDWKDDSPEAASESSDSDNGSAGTPLPPVSQTVPVMPKTAAGVPGPPIYTNIRMCDPTNGMHGKASTPPVPRVIPPVSRDGGHSKPFQDEREVKRQRRMQSNRDASERSRLRKQAEFDKLAQDTELLNAENASLRAEMNRLKSKREELASENTSLKDLLLSFPPLEGIKLEKDDQEPDTYQTGFTERKFVSYKDSTLESKTNSQHRYKK